MFLNSVNLGGFYTYIVFNSQGWDYKEQLHGPKMYFWDFCLERSCPIFPVFFLGKAPKSKNYENTSSEYFFILPWLFLPPQKDI